MKFSLATTLCLLSTALPSALGWEADFYAGTTQIGAAGSRGRFSCHAISGTRSASSVTFTGGNGRYLLQVFAGAGCKTLIRTFANANDAEVRSAVRSFKVIRSYSKRDEQVDEEDYLLEEDDFDEDSFSEGIEPPVIPGAPRTSPLEKRLPGVQCQLDSGNLITNCQNCATSCQNGEAQFPMNGCCEEQENCNICREVCYCS